MVVAVTQVTAAVVAAVVLTVEHRVSPMVIARRVLTVTLRLALMRTHAQRRIHAPKRLLVLKLHQALTLVVQTNPHAHPIVATTVATTMIAHRAPVATLAILVTAAATLAAVKIVVQRLLSAVVRIRASALRVLMPPHVRTKPAKSVVHSAVIVRTLVLPLVVTATAMIAQRALSVTVIHVRSLIARHALTRIVEIACNALLALLLHAANTPRVHAASVLIHSSVRNVRNTRHVPRVHSSMKPALRATRSVRQVPLQRLQPMAAIALHVVLPSRLNMLLR